MPLRNPNLKRHYRSVADLCILGLIFSVIVIAIALSKFGLTLGVMLMAAHAVLLLVTIVFVYKSRMPWDDGRAKFLIWTVFTLALFFNVVLPLVFAGNLNIPAIVVYAIIFPYLFWLSSQAGKCAARGDYVLPAQEKL